VDNTRDYTLVYPTVDSGLAITYSYPLSVRPYSLLLSRTSKMTKLYYNVLLHAYHCVVEMLTSIRLKLSLSVCELAGF